MVTTATTSSGMKELQTLPTSTSMMSRLDSASGTRCRMREVKERWTLSSRVFDRGDENAAGRRKFVYEGVCGGWINYPDAQGVMQPCDPAFSIGDSGGFNAMFTRIPRIVRLGDDSRKRVYPVPGNDSVWFQLYKPTELTLGAPTMKAGGVWTWDRTNYTFKLHLRPDRVKFSLLLKRDLGMNTLHLPFESAGLTRNGFALRAGGQTVARLRKPFVRDAVGVERDLEATIAGGEIVLTLDDTGLTYPLLIDPPLDLNVAASADDDRVYRLPTPNWSNTVTDGRSGYGTSSFYALGSSMRFTGVNIPAAATMTPNASYLTLIAAFNAANVTVISNVCAENANNPGQIA